MLCVCIFLWNFIGAFLFDQKKFIFKTYTSTHTLLKHYHNGILYYYMAKRMNARVSREVVVATAAALPHKSH